MKNIDAFIKVNDLCRMRGLPLVSEDQFLVVLSAMALEGKIEIDGDEVNARYRSVLVGEV